MPTRSVKVSPLRSAPLYRYERRPADVELTAVGYCAIGAYGVGKEDQTLCSTLRRSQTSVYPLRRGYNGGVRHHEDEQSLAHACRAVG